MRPPALTLPLAAWLIMAGCGYVGDPRPPALNMPQKIADLRVVESGESIVIEFTVPDSTTELLPLTRLGEVELRLGPGGAAPFDLGRWSESAPRIPVMATSPGPIKIKTSAKSWAGREVLLAVRVSSAKGRFSDWAGPVVLSVVEPVGTPAGVSAEAAPNGVKLSWQSAPRPGLAFRVYRRAEAEKAASLVATPAASGWIDTATAFGERYAYSVQAVVKTGESEAESEISPATEIVPVDKFPPAVPTGLTAAASPDSVELAWERNTDPDFAGYRVYRSLDRAAFEKIADSLDAPNHSDRGIAGGKRYRYAVSAVDLLGNESARSQTVEVATQ
jgi:hypothetical protein